MSDEPRTAAGRDLVTNAVWDSDKERLLLPGYVSVDDLRRDVVAIEAEAAGSHWVSVTATNLESMTVDAGEPTGSRAAGLDVDARLRILLTMVTDDCPCYICSEVRGLTASATSGADE